MGTGETRGLVVVDVQKDFCPGGALPVSQGDQIVPIINGIRDRFDLVVFTKDWHPSSHVSFASSHGKEVGDTVIVEGQTQLLWPEHCIQDSPGAEFVEDLDYRDGDKIVLKGIEESVDSYSTFYDNLKRRSTGLSDHLREQGVNVVYIAGLAIDYCVKWSVIDAIEEGFQVFVVEDACRGVDVAPGDSQRALDEMREKGAHIIKSMEV